MGWEEAHGPSNTTAFVLTWPRCQGNNASMASASVDGGPLYLGLLSGFSLQAALEPYDGAEQQEAAGLALDPGYSLSSQPRVSNGLVSALTAETRTLSGGGKQSVLTGAVSVPPGSRQTERKSKCLLGLGNCV